MGKEEENSRKGTPATKAASKARCVTDFTREGVKKYIHSRRRALRKNLQAVYCQELPKRFAKEEENQRGPKRDIQKHSICKFCGVNFNSGGERASFEKPFSPVGAD